MTVPIVKFHENASSGSRIDACGLTGERSRQGAKGAESIFCLFCDILLIFFAMFLLNILNDSGAMLPNFKPKLVAS
jgi:hypothetical protein